MILGFQDYQFLKWSFIGTVIFKMKQFRYVIDSLKVCDIGCVIISILYWMLSEAYLINTSF
jgi:hypothetical protein